MLPAAGSVSMASSSAGALRPASPAMTLRGLCQFQWPLRRPGRCARSERQRHSRTRCFNGLFVGRGAAPISRWVLPRLERGGFNGLFVGRGAAPGCMFIPAESAGLFQWPLRRPGRCALRFSHDDPAIEDGFNGLFVGRGAAPGGGVLAPSDAQPFQWPLRRPGRCAARTVPAWVAGCRVSMASSSAGALRPPVYVGPTYYLHVSMASSSAGALRREQLATLTGIPGGFNGLFVGRGAAPIEAVVPALRCQEFQWPLRRPGRCAC